MKQKLIYTELKRSKSQSHTVNGIDIIYGAKPVLEDYSAIILAVGHQEFKSWDIRKSDQKVLYDMKGLLSKKLVDARL